MASIRAWSCSSSPAAVAAAEAAAASMIQLCVFLAWRTGLEGGRGLEEPCSRRDAAHGPALLPQVAWPGRNLWAGPLLKS
jgi:hypothetical protein